MVYDLQAEQGDRVIEEFGAICGDGRVLRERYGRGEAGQAARRNVTGRLPVARSCRQFADFYQRNPATTGS
jgi:hypothetical protein